MEGVLNDKWLGIEEVANYLGVNKDSVRNWIKILIQVFRHIKIGHQ